MKLDKEYLTLSQCEIDNRDISTTELHFSVGSHDDLVNITLTITFDDLILLMRNMHENATGE